MQSPLDYITFTWHKQFQLEKPLPFSYGGNGEGLHITDAGRDFLNGASQPDLENPDWFEWNGQPIPDFFGKQSPESVIDETNDETLVNVDIIANSFLFLSGWQETHYTGRDELGRFPFKQSIQHRHGLAEVPVVNYYFDILRVAVRRHHNILLSPQHWNPGEWALALTHDVDLLNSGWKQELPFLLKRGKIWSAIRLLSQELTGKRIWHNFRTITDLESRHGAHSSFYFLTTTETIDEIPHADYYLTDKLLAEVKQLERRGFEAGLHFRRGAHLKADELQKDIYGFNHPAIGGRYHFLSFDPMRTPSVLDQSRLEYDSTLGFAEQPGFRHGYAHPFYLYDLFQNQPTHILEIPLVIMDTTLFHSKYLNLRAEQALDQSRRVLNEVEKFNGAAAVLWHNNAFGSYKYAHWQKGYLELLRMIRGRGGLMATATELQRRYAEH